LDFDVSLIQGYTNVGWFFLFQKTFDFIFDIKKTLVGFLSVGSSPILHILKLAILVLTNKNSNSRTFGFN
jgi:hypothetical protein